MPIKIVSVYATSDGQTFSSEDEAKAHELAELIGEDEGATGGANVAEAVGKWILRHANEIIAILTAKPDAPPKRRPRSDKGKPHAKRNNVPVKEGVA